MNTISRKRKFILYATFIACIGALALIASSLGYYFVKSAQHGNIDATYVIFSILSRLPMAIVIALTLLLIWPICRGATPFTHRSVLLLRGAAVMLLVEEPLQALIGKVYLWLSPLPSNATIYTIPWYVSGRGTVFAIGLIVLSLSVIFAHGVSLQRADDETL